ncbi:prepilin-type N-terminal cleavage/methylation domain-containing protein [Alicyclobacillus fastidiosus]|uniref:Prepilin-type N-terminal cleavage/methylation domain-containing protein n=1 Tax=Alicyclobacillus fastidiosus TaxID=392011 RepID=A0ABY6ZHK5_9BACL|nr:prepilin-type N-terminal cleavage/methylation domain-containing protein [Alicyclobacillus fastidiosus]WAH41706.1 prepilin-type N-terminal cleavage/methylation domain-containing protein [Alicyclobacillus fastidiosus]GMA63385.1 hypothetical protein GCM10025859_38250 [Alicyclobacillus fastidiosus]
MQFSKRMRSQGGLTLIELMAAIVISVMVGGVILAILWGTASRSNSLLTYNAAERQVLLVNHALVKELHTADYVQVQSTAGEPGTRQVTLWLYKGGYVQNPNLTPAWLYNTTTVQAEPASNNSTAEAVVGAQCFAAFVFTQAKGSTWNVTYTTNVPTTPPSACPTSLSLSSIQSTALLNVSGLQVAWDFPNLFGDAGGPPVDVQCKFVNSFVIRLSATYQSSTGQTTTYALTAGYHNKDVR